jgi:undecaprenyl-phosphate galactose phosphotransferase/putative colanic acid biosynthesis UDP-glucose lipid carrier transferase
MQREPLTFAQRAIKRSIDIALSSLALIAFLPLFSVLGVLIKLDSRGPAMFRQTRNGLGGKPFRIFKFRTMSVMEDGDDVCQAVRKDCRVTRVGRFLRRTSLDELPQLLNVLNGEMSLVGPRPHARAHDEHFATLVENYHVRQHVKPGLTGWAQVNGYRGETPTIELMRRRLEYDLWYAANASLSLDFLILLRTLPALLGQGNAY